MKFLVPDQVTFIYYTDSTPAFVEHVSFFQLQELRKELDILLQEKIESPHPVDWKDTKSRDCAVLSAIIDLIKTQERATPRSLPPRLQDGHHSWQACSVPGKATLHPSSIMV